MCKEQLSMVIRIIIFLVLNFGALALGGLFTGPGVSSSWYQNLNQAPWTPPGWLFGVAWTTIMLCFSLYMAFLWSEEQNKTLLILAFSLQWILNVSWNPTFFFFHQIGLGLVVITALTLLVGFFLFYFWPALKVKSLLILPYFLWLLIATSLNAFMALNN